MEDTLTKSAFFSRSLLVALLIPFTLACTGLSIFTANSKLMQGTLSTLMPPLCTFVVLVVLILFLAQLPYLFVKKHWFVSLNSFLFGCGFLLWVQANVFNWNFGELDGSGVDWTAFRHLMVLEIVIYLLVIGLVIWQRQRIYKYVIHLACLLIFMQSVGMIKQVQRILGEGNQGWKQYEITYDDFFDYSKEQNVLLIIPDAFSAQLFQRIINKYPEVAEWFSDFNYFPNQKSQGTTVVSIPQIFTACDEEGYKQNADSLWNSEGALLKTLTEAGFQTRLHVQPPNAYYWDHRWISNIRLKESAQDSLRRRSFGNYLSETGIGHVVDLTIVRTVPIIFKPADFESFRLIQPSQVTHIESDSSHTHVKPTDDQTLAQIILKNPVSANSHSPVITAIHLRGAHAPYNFNEKFEYEVMPGIEGEERQALATLLLIKRLFDAMKTAEVYDNTRIFIVADHGNNFPSKLLTYIDDKPQFYNPLLLVKRQNERHEAIVYRDTHTNVRDITPTILDLVGLKNLPGRFSIFDIPADILVQREAEYEAFWIEKHKERIGKTRFTQNRRLLTLSVLYMKNTGERLPQWSSEIALKRSELVVNYGQLCWYVGDDPDIWNRTYPNHNGIIVMASPKKSAPHYQGTLRLAMPGGNTKGGNYWFSAGIIDLTNVADGEYEVAFLLPQRDGSYVKNLLGVVAVTSGAANVL